MTPALSFWLGLCVGAVGGYWIPRLAYTLRLRRRLRQSRGSLTPIKRRRTDGS